MSLSQIPAIAPGTQPSAETAVRSFMDAQTETPVQSMDLLRPYLMVACIAFVVGFTAFLAAGWAVSPRTAVAEPYAAPVSTPVIVIDPASARIA